MGLSWLWGNLDSRGCRGEVVFSMITRDSRAAAHQSSGKGNCFLALMMMPRIASGWRQFCRRCTSFEAIPASMGSTNMRSFPSLTRVSAGGTTTTTPKGVKVTVTSTSAFPIKRSATHGSQCINLVRSRNSSIFAFLYRVSVSIVAICLR